MCSIRIEALGDKTFTVEVTLEKPISAKDKTDMEMYPHHVSKEFSAADGDAVKTLIDEYLPALQPRRESAEFDEAFDKAIKGSSKPAKDDSTDD
jgi:hypothetical protein